MRVPFSVEVTCVQSEDRDDSDACAGGTGRGGRVVRLLGDEAGGRREADTAADAGARGAARNGKGGSARREKRGAEGIRAYAHVACGWRRGIHGEALRSRSWRQDRGSAQSARDGEERGRGLRALPARAGVRVQQGRSRLAGAPWLALHAVLRDEDAARHVHRRDGGHAL